MTTGGYSERDARILDAALDLARVCGYQWITRRDVADKLGCSPGTVSNFGYVQTPDSPPRGDPMIRLKRAVMEAAVEREVLEVIAQGLTDGSPIALAAPAAVRRRALDVLMAIGSMS